MMLHTKYQGSWPYSFRKEDFFQCLPYISLRKQCDLRGGESFLAPGACFEHTIGLLSDTTYVPNIKAQSLMVSDKKIFSCFFPI